MLRSPTFVILTSSLGRAGSLNLKALEEGNHGRIDSETLPAASKGLHRQDDCLSEPEAPRQRWPCVIAVVDDGGHLIALEHKPANALEDAIGAAFPW